MAENNKEYSQQSNYSNSNISSNYQKNQSESNVVDLNEGQEEIKEQVYDEYEEGQKNIEKAFSIINKIPNSVEKQALTNNPVETIKSLDFLTEEEQDLLIKTLNNIQKMIIQVHDTILQYCEYQSVCEQLKESLTQGSVLLFQIRSIIEILMKDPRNQNYKSQQSLINNLIQEKEEKDQEANNKNKHQNLQNEEQKGMEPYINDLGKYFINSQNRDQINLEIFAITANILNNYLEEIIGICNSILQPKLEKRLQSYLNDHKIIQAKLITVSEFISFAVIFDKNDIFALDQKNHPTWKKINNYIEYVQIAPKEILKKKFQAIAQRVLLGSAMQAKGAERKSKFGQWIQRNLSAVYYLCNPQTSQRKAEIFYSRPNQKTAIDALNMMDKSLIYRAIKIILPSIKYNKKIYIDRDNKRITKEVVLEEYKNNTINTLHNPYHNYHDESISYMDEDAYYNQLFKKDANKVKIRILSSQNLIRPKNYENMQEKDRKWHNTVIIHIHGGGFVSMGTRSHQIYSRKWANLLNIPIFSIDYLKAPEHPYPEGLDDCFQTYQWIIKNVHKYFNIKPEKVIVVGDSAGGNLTITLTSLCIKYGVKVPDGIVPIYPALNLNLETFTPSYIIALDDQILPHMFLKMCLRAYIEKDGCFDPKIDPFISPIYTSDEILQKFPPVRLQTGNNDPLSDDCFRFLNKLIDNNINARLTVYNDMTHGYLNYDVPGGMKHASKCVEDSTEMIKELLSLNPS